MKSKIIIVTFFITYIILFLACKKKCLLAYHQVPAFLSLSPAKEMYKIGLDTIILKVEIPYKSFTYLLDNPIDVQKYLPGNIYFSITPQIFTNGVPDSIIPDPIGKGLIDILYEGRQTNYAARTWPFYRTDSSWLFMINIIPKSINLSNSMILLRTSPFQYQDACVLIEYIIQPHNTNPNWHIATSLLPNHRPYDQDFYFLLK